MGLLIIAIETGNDAMTTVEQVGRHIEDLGIAVKCGYSDLEYIDGLSTRDTNGNQVTRMVYVEDADRSQFQESAQVGLPFITKIMEDQNSRNGIMGSDIIDCFHAVRKECVYPEVVSKIFKKLCRIY